MIISSKLKKGFSQIINFNEEAYVMFRIQPCIVEFLRPIGVGEHWLRERGSLPATFYILTRVFF